MTLTQNGIVVMHDIGEGYCEGSNENGAGRPLVVCTECHLGDERVG